MSQYPLERVQELFVRAVELPPDQRPAFLARECGEDAGLRGEVESLLAHHDQAGSSFLEPPVRPRPGAADDRATQSRAAADAAR